MTRVGDMSRLLLLLEKCFGSLYSLPQTTKRDLCNIYIAGFDRACAPRALRAPVFLGSLTRKTERCAPPAPHIAASLILPAILMIYTFYTIEKPPRKVQVLEKNPRKCTTSQIVQ